jgi:hypothetical protein
MAALPPSAEEAWIDTSPEDHHGHAKRGRIFRRVKGFVKNVATLRAVW